MNKHFLPYDIYERHKRVGEQIEGGDTVLDVGGQLNLLSGFCRPQKIVVANLAESQEKSDVKIKQGPLPFTNGSFSTVCAIDVLEHVSKSQRQKFIKDLLRVASKKAILSFPIGTESHVKYEKSLKRILFSKGIDVTYLNEHIKLGLPTIEEIKNYTQGKSSAVSYSGDLAMVAMLFRLFLFDPKIKFMRKLVFLLKGAFNFLTNPIFYLLLSKRQFSDKVVRAYVTIYKS